MSTDELGGEVFAIHLCPGHRQAMQKVAQARAVEGFGLEGDSHARSKSKRQMLLVELETLMVLDIPLSAVRDNITTRGIELMKLKGGQKLRLGETVHLEITQPCEPCSRMDEIRPGLKKALEGRRGILAKVIVGGVFCVGDPIEVVD
ncbi:MAG: MOSC domain-containing protein [Acidobacteria bacterium]|nr:MAG: MOSC domain-containing protein [Acidobacteriota bacterium]